MTQKSTHLRILHKESGLLIGDGPRGWGITPFEGNFYIGRKYLRTDRFRTNFVPGICPYKFLYVWMDLHVDDQDRVRNLGWMYVIPNPVLPFIWFRIAVPANHPSIEVIEY